MNALNKLRISIRPEGLTIVSVGVGILIVSSSFPDLPEGYPGPGLFPRGIGILLTLSGLLISFGRKGISNSESSQAEKNNIWRFAGLLLIVFCFPLFYRLGHFFLALFICVGVVAILFKIKWWKSILISSLTCAAIYLLFIQILRVPL